MNTVKFNLDKSIIKFSNFAKALALPVRIWTIRVILENGNSATREMLHQIPFKGSTVNQHLNELKYLGIIKTVRKDKITFFSVNEDVFIQMSKNFILLFESIGQFNEEAKSIFSRTKLKKKQVIVEVPSIQSFGAYIKERRKTMHISQKDFSVELQIYRGLLSRVECCKKSLKPEKLYKVAEILDVPITEITKVYYQDKMNQLNNESERFISKA